MKCKKLWKLWRHSRCSSRSSSVLRGTRSRWVFDPKREDKLSPKTFFPRTSSHQEDQAASPSQSSSSLRISSCKSSNLQVQAQDSPSLQIIKPPSHHEDQAPSPSWKFSKSSSRQEDQARRPSQGTSNLKAFKSPNVQVLKPSNLQISKSSRASSSLRRKTPKSPS